MRNNLISMYMDEYKFGKDRTELSDKWESEESKYKEVSAPRFRTVHGKYVTLMESDNPWYIHENEVCPSKIIDEPRKINPEFTDYYQPYGDVKSVKSHQIGYSIKDIMMKNLVENFSDKTNYKLYIYIISIILMMMFINYLIFGKVFIIY